MEKFTTDSNITYEIDEENKVVLAHIDDYCGYEFIKIVQRNLIRYGLDEDEVTFAIKRIAKLAKKGILKEKYTGKAVCHPNDVFNKEIGMKIARNRAIIKREAAYMRASYELFMSHHTEWEMYGNLMINRSIKLNNTIGGIAGFLDLE